MKRKTLSRSKGFDKNPKPLQLLNIVIAHNNGLNSGVTDTEQLRSHSSRIEV